jgi:transmembrane sensor
MITVPFPNQKEIEERAASWVAAIDRGLEANEECALSEWLEASPFHGEMLVKCASMWDLLDVLQPIAKLMPIDQTLAVTQTSSVGDSLEAANESVWFKPMAMVASVLLLVSITVFLNLPDRSTPIVGASEDSSIVAQEQQYKPKIYRAAVGEISIIPLSDGSVLELNTDSVVAVRFTKSQRNIELMQGEVYFDVAKDATRPFVVKVGEDEVTAIGTAFSVDAGNLLKKQHSVDEVIVTEGKVRVKRRNSQAPIYLVTGQKVTARDDILQVSSEADSDSLLAWREGVVVFEGESLTEVVREIDRYTPLKFRIVDKELASISVGGLFKTGDLDQLLLVLENNFGVVSQKIGNEVILSKAN